MRVAARTAALLFGATALGLGANAARSDGVPLFAWQATAVCETPAVAAELTPGQAQGLCADPTVLVVDVRPHESFQRGHIPNAIHLPCQTDRLENQTFTQLSQASAILVYGDTTEEAHAVADSLAERRLPVHILAGGYPGWEAAGMACSSGPCNDCLGKLHEH